MEKRRINNIKLYLIQLEESKKIKLIAQKYLNLKDSKINKIIIPTIKNVKLQDQLQEEKTENNIWNYKTNINDIIRN